MSNLTAPVAFSCAGVQRRDGISPGPNLAVSAAVASLIAASCIAGRAEAQSAAESAPPGGLSEVVITGSRIVRDGFEAPTPLTVMSTEDIQASGVKDISEFTQDLPAIVGSWDLQSRSRQTSNGTNGLASPGLRNLGPNRTLILLDGRRSAPSAQTGEVDVATFPQMLISRVDVVTGGASAVYGSDALSGVINYVLDKEFTGFKTELSGGITRYGDDENGRFQFAWGLPFAGGRGHVLLSGEVYRSNGVLGSSDGTPPERKWMQNPDVRMDNPAYTPTNGLPFQIVLPDSGDPRAIKNGALIYAGPLRGTAFDGNGNPFQFRFGIVSNNRMSGGDWELTDMTGNTTIDPKQKREGVFTRASFELTDNVSAYAQIAWNHNDNIGAFCCFQKTNININVAANPFLHPTVRQQAQALGVTSFTLGTYVEGTKLAAAVDRDIKRYLGGFEGRFDAFGRSWAWDASYQMGILHSDQFVKNDPITPRFTEALDAVSDPATGAAICRSKLTNPATTCAPFNPFGWGVASQAALDYVGITDDAYRYERYQQNVASVSVSGEPVSLWAGPLSVAFGAEYRTEELQGVVDEWSVNFQRDSNNFQATNGKYHVAEAFFETAIPLIRDKSWTQSLEFNGAVRRTDYSVSGLVTTWKVGLTWSVIDDLRFRFTQSRDIRAPNMAELFTRGQGILQNVDDRFTGQNPRIFGLIQGNIDLKPEEADTTGVGVVLNPRFLPGVTASIDYYNIDLSGAIGTVMPQQIIDYCFEGNTAFCSALTRDASGVLLRVNQQPFNFLKQLSKGIDFDLVYRRNLAGGNIAFRWLATHFLEAYIDRGDGSLARDTVGENPDNLPFWRHRFSVNYSYNPFTVDLSARAITSGKINNLWIECDSGCPASTTDRQTLQVGANHVPGYLYFDTAATYRFKARNIDSEVFVSVRNLLDKDPPRAPQLGSQGNRGARVTYDGVFDMLGRQYRAGVRFVF